MNVPGMFLSVLANISMLWAPQMVHLLSTKLMCFAGQGYLPLHCAALSGDIKVARLLANYAPDTLHAVSRKNQTPLRVAEVRGHKVEMLKAKLGIKSSALSITSGAPLSSVLLIVFCDIGLHRKM